MMIASFVERYTWMIEKQNKRRKKKFQKQKKLRKIFGDNAMKFGYAHLSQVSLNWPHFTCAWSFGNVKMFASCRVTRLGRFSPIGLLLEAYCER